jgi:addiction module RelB/DinJ family antitoxin
MSAILRTEMLRARVYPHIRYAGEDVLRRIGLNMSDVMDLLLRRMIIDQKLPFEVAALDDATLAAATERWTKEARKSEKSLARKSLKRSKRQKRE